MSYPSQSLFMLVTISFLSFGNNGRRYLSEVRERKGGSTISWDGSTQRVDFTYVTRNLVHRGPVKRPTIRLPFHKLEFVRLYRTRAVNRDDPTECSKNDRSLPVLTLDPRLHGSTILESSSVSNGPNRQEGREETKGKRNRLWTR